MPRPKRVCPAGEVFRVLNRAVAWPTIFEKPEDETGGTGHLYQGRFKSFPVQSDDTSCA